MNDWVELKVILGDKVEPLITRIYRIESVYRTGTNSCTVYCEGAKAMCYHIAESYEDVLAKIKKAEEPQVIPVAEHFTMEEYKFLLNTLETISGSANGPGVKVGRKIIETLKEILEEDK